MYFKCREITIPLTSAETPGLRILMDAKIAVTTATVKKMINAIKIAIYSVKLGASFK